MFSLNPVKLYYCFGLTTICKLIIDTLWILYMILFTNQIYNLNIGILFSGPGTGVPFHFHGPGFGEVIFGRKRWFLTPPDRQPHFHPNRTTLQWLHEDYDELHPAEVPLECTINQGEVIASSSKSSIYYQGCQTLRQTQKTHREIFGKINFCLIRMFSASFRCRMINSRQADDIKFLTKCCPPLVINFFLPDFDPRGIFSPHEYRAMDFSYFYYRRLHWIHTVLVSYAYNHFIRFNIKQFDI